MRTVVQRVSHARVRVDGTTVGEIGHGFVLLVGVAVGDTAADVDAGVAKILGLRVFTDGEGRMNRSLDDVGGAVIVVSQFTLLADVRKGRRPSFGAAAPPEDAEELINAMCAGLEAGGLSVATGTFGAHMEVELVNDGPVTIILDVVNGRVV